MQLWFEEHPVKGARGLVVLGSRDGHSRLHLLFHKWFECGSFHLKIWERNNV